jgi:antitoxin VapB
MVYTFLEVIAMETAKIFFSGNSQAVRLPKEYRFSGDELGIKKIGDIVLLFQKDSAWESFLNTEPVDDDFGEAILDARFDTYPNSPRESL